MKNSLPFLIVLLLAGCDDRSSPLDPNVEVFGVPLKQVEGSRFKVETFGAFNAGFQNGKREILIITDTKTGQSYLGITGVGITELRWETVGKINALNER